MSSIVRAALVQAEWTGDVESMIEKRLRDELGYYDLELDDY